MNLQRCYIFLITFIVVLSSCGGGGGGGGSNPIITGTSSSESVVIPPAVVLLAPEFQGYTLDEDNALFGAILLNFDGLSASADGEKLISIIRTRNGGVVEILPSDGTSPRVLFRYTPAEDFNGEDDCDIYLTKYNSDSTLNKQKLKIAFHVLPVVDEGLKFNIIEKKVFVANDVVRLSFPYDPDTHVSVPADSNFKLTIDDVPVDYSTNADGLSFVMPANLLAGANALNVQFEYQGKTAKLTRSVMSKIDYGDVEYWMGDKARPGVTYVVMTEARVNRQQYLDWVNAEFTKLLSHPLIAQYSQYWNIVVIKQPAPENYASLTNEAASPIIIGDLKTSGEDFIKKFVPNYDWVILNTNLNGRATGGYPMVVNFSPINVILHEFGHVHARLADEYADTTVSSSSNPSYMEGYNPNVTNFNNYEAIPWKHWIVDKTKIPGVNVGSDLNGVGAFLGAIYVDNKFYRPMLSSIMRDTSAPFGPIFSEAWVLATYERMGILGSVTSTKNANLRTINVAKSWSKNLTRIDWFLNDVKQDAWANQSTVVANENNITTNSYSIKAELTDLSGYIKNPHAYSAFKRFNQPDLTYGNDSLVDVLKGVANENFQKEWVFEKASVNSTLKLQKQDAHSDVQLLANGREWVSHKVTIENGVHQLVSSSRYEIQDTLPPVTAHSELRADVIDAFGKHLYSMGIDSPYRYYHGASGMVILKGSGNYNLKHPYVNGSYRIAIVDLKTQQRVAAFDFSQ